MQGIELNLIEAYGGKFILGSKIGYSLDGVVYNADLYIDQKIYPVMIIRYWFGSGLLFRIKEKTGRDTLLNIEKKIEDWLNSAEHRPSEYTKRVIINLISKGARTLGFILVVFTMVRIISSGATPLLIAKGVIYLIAIICLKIISLKIYAIKYNK